MHHENTLKIMGMSLYRDIHGIWSVHQILCISKQMFILSRGGICLLIWKITKCNDKVVGKRGAMTCHIVKKCYTSKEQTTNCSAD